MTAESAGAPEGAPISRRSFLSVAASAGAGAALDGIVTPSSHAATHDALNGTHPGGHDSAPATYYGGSDPKTGDRPASGIPKVGLRWAFSASVFFADRVMINSITSPSGRGYTSVGGGEIWGPRLQGRVLPHSGADYYKTTFSTYYMLEAADGALIFIHNRGTMRRFKAPYEPGKPLLAPEPNEPPADVWTRFRATPVFTAPKGPHDWMNHTVFVA